MVHIFLNTMLRQEPFFITMHKASWLEPFHNNIGKKTKTICKHNQYFPFSVGKHQQYIQRERWLPNQGNRS